ncbi:hypothetical protein Trydic_g19596 [Trypoxylus dichotomus]
MCARWVPQILSEEHKTCIDFLDCYDEEGDEVLNHIATAQSGHILQFTAQPFSRPYLGRRIPGSGKPSHPEIKLAALEATAKADGLRLTGD